VNEQESQKHCQPLGIPYDLGPITLSYLLKTTGNSYLGPFTKLSVPHRVKHIARLSRGFQHY